MQIIDPSTPLELSIVLPCLNEQRTVGRCIDKASSFLLEHGIHGEIVVADNGSTDESVRIATEHGARVAHVPNKGYGNALRGGFAEAYGKYIIMADADDSYDLKNLLPFVEKLREGYDLVMGNRFKGGIRPGAMPWHHRYIGNPILSFIGRLFFRSPSRDFHCGLRGFSKEAIQRMDLQSTGMELASEIVIKASILGMKATEVPTPLFPDGRLTRPHLRSFRDGWRHLRFLLLYSPRWLFFYPGLAMTLLAGAASIALFFGPVDIGIRPLDFHSFILAGTALMLGLSMISFATITRVFAYNAGYLPRAPMFFKWFKYITLETGLFISFVLALLGILIIVRATLLSTSPGFGVIGFGSSVRLVFGGSLAIMIAGQLTFTSFMLSILGLWTRK